MERLTTSPGGTWHAQGGSGVRLPRVCRLWDVGSLGSVPGATEEQRVLCPSRSGETHIPFRHCVASRRRSVGTPHLPCGDMQYFFSHFSAAGTWRVPAGFPELLFLGCSVCAVAHPPSPLSHLHSAPHTHVSGFMPGLARVWPSMLTKRY